MEKRWLKSPKRGQNKFYLLVCTLPPPCSRMILWSSKVEFKWCQTHRRNKILLFFYICLSLKKDLFFIYQGNSWDFYIKIPIEICWNLIFCRDIVNKSTEPLIVPNFICSYLFVNSFSNYTLYKNLIPFDIHMSCSSAENYFPQSEAPLTKPQHFLTVWWKVDVKNSH